MNEVSTVYLSLGSNLGDRYQYLLNALAELSNKVGTVKLISETYENPPSGFQADQDFLNLCAEVYTRLSPDELLATLKNIEEELGRTKDISEGYSSRPIDIDIILYDDLILSKENLTIPHPHFRKRRFVLKPLSTIAYNKIDPETKLTIGQLFNNCSDQSIMRIYNRSKF
ncbi:MAG: 2-amino-4-hydroxy-6-hydroxymethyldihydropteridine diphosphokinase [Crocinitomicaceae bacterium]|nr:2-amino-4-hydroxy-6-hydroxymethyldihydropteridine diphosphokinase [Crocinitomicaceae bacterium]